MKVGFINFSILLVFSFLNLRYIPINGSMTFSQHHVNYYKFPRCTSKSKDVGACIHKYSEKDFLSISSIVYPKLKGRVLNENNNRCKSGETVLKSNTIMMDGPTLDASCDDLRHVYNCLLTELQFCDSLVPFFQLRHLLYTMKKIITWLCGSGEMIYDDAHEHSVVRSRFLVLLESIKCLECVRVNESTCKYNSELVKSTSEIVDSETLWNQILRMEISHEQCGNIKKKMICLQENHLILQICGEKANELYSNLTQLFLGTWCDQSPFGFSGTVITKLDNSLNIILSILFYLYVYFS